MLLSTGQWDGSDKGRVADARRIVQGCGAKAVRDGVAHAQYLQRTGRLKGTLRGCIVTAAQGYRTGSWAPDPGMAAEAKRQQQAKQAQANAQRKAQAQRQAADRLAAEEDADRLLWSQLSAQRREQLHRAVLARIGHGHPAARFSIDSPPMRALILDELEQQTA